MTSEREGTIAAKYLEYGDVLYDDKGKGNYVRNVKTEGDGVVVTLRNGEVKKLRPKEEVHYKRRFVY